MTISTTLQPFVDQHILAGAVTLVASKDRILSHQAVGFANIADQHPMQPDSLFWIASISKPITAVALLMLVDEGKLTLDDPVTRFLPEFTGQMLAVEQDAAHELLKPLRSDCPITVRHLLCHTSGLPFMSRVEAGKIDRLTLAEAVISYAMSPLRFEPGARYEYSNAGTNTCGRLIEVLSGLSYESFVTERLLAPLGMRETVMRPPAAQLRRLATAYKPTAAGDGLTPFSIEQLTQPYDLPRRQPSPAGGFFSTATDLARFGQMLLAGGMYQGRRYLSTAAFTQLITKQTGALENAYGCCVDVNPTTGGFGHGGALATDLRIEPRSGLVLIYLVQHGGYPGTRGGEIVPDFRTAALAQYASAASAPGH